MTDTHMQNRVDNRLACLIVSTIKGMRLRVV